MRLARKITLALTLLAIVVLIAESAAEALRVWERVPTEMKQNHLLLGRTLTGSLRKAWKLEGEQEALALLDEANRYQSQVALRWVWVDGPQAPDALEPWVLNELRHNRPASQEVGSGASEVLTTYFPAHMSGKLGAIQLTESLAAKQAALRRAVRTTALATAAIAVLYVVTALGLGRRMVGQPVQALAAQARRIASGDLQARVRLDQKDELGALAVAMNEMTQALSDAHERLQSETAARIATLESLRHADRLTTVGKLAAGVAHELGTPLNVVYSRGRMIASGEEDGDQAKQSGKIIAEQAQVMIRIIRQLLDFARRREPMRTPEDLRALSDRTLSLLQPLAAKKQVALSAEHVPPIEVEVDGGQMQQVLTNLLMNAVQSMGAPGTVRMEASKQRAAPPPGVDGGEGDFVRLDVVDEGSGIAPDVLPHIFEPFFTTKGIGEGTGLGLSVSYGIVRDHGGWIAVETAPGKGSRFSVYLPTRPARAAA
ncbi:MAG TPA: ATP-binding protein [Myxococcaceae bacterium]|nr:ATP-binding protein [Myxococcaceae bacterium]